MVLHLKLEIQSDGSIAIVTCTESGARTWNILRIRTNGTLGRYTSIAPEIGLQLDSRGRILVS